MSTCWEEFVKTLNAPANFDAVVEVLSTKMCVTSSNQDLEDTSIERRERHRRYPSDVVYDEIGFTGFLVEAVAAAVGSLMLRRTTSNGIGVLDGLTLSVIEV